MFNLTLFSAEFSSSKLILPLIILACLCLLTVLMCYKSYEEKRSVLPKVFTDDSLTDW